MNPEAQAKVDEILAQSPEAITEEDRAFLAARRSYLSKEQQEAYGVAEAPAKATKAAKEDKE